jgi:adenosylcobinamide-phosphate synthase
MIYIILGAILLDLLIGDPKILPHPVVLIGRCIASLEKKLNHGHCRKLKGMLLTLIIVGAVYALTLLAVMAAYRLSVLAGIALEIYLIFTTIAIKGLKQAAHAVARPLRLGKLAEARQAVGRVVGRDTEQLEEREVVRATVETVAENTVDAITAPLFWAFLGGAPAAMAYRACNTLDSMVGYRNEQFLQFGWASARLDDLANWLPARLTAMCMWLAACFIAGFNRAGAWRLTWRDAPGHPSPNSGWPETMAAALLGVQLGGRNSYGGVASLRATMGEPLQALNVQHIQRTVVLMHGAWIVLYLLLAVIAAAWSLVN